MNDFNFLIYAFLTTVGTCAVYIAGVSYIEWRTNLEKKKKETNSNNNLLEPVARFDWGNKELNKIAAESEKPRFMLPWRTGLKPEREGVYWVRIQNDEDIQGVIYATYLKNEDIAKGMWLNTKITHWL